MPTDNNVRLVDLVIDKKWNVIDDMVDQMVAKKIFDKIDNYKHQYIKNNGSFDKVDEPEETGTNDG
jgi:hypothetical protein